MGIKKLSEYINEGIVEDKTLLDILAHAKDKYADKTALVDFEKRITYKELWDEASRCAVIFSENGLKKGDHVTLWFNNRIEYFECLFGLFMTGVVPVLLLPTHRKNELFTITRFGECKAIITYGKDLGYDYLDTALSYAHEFDEEIKVFSFEDNEDSISMNTDTGKRFEPVDIKGDDVALFLLSGGTTGVPKLIPKKHAAYYYNAKYCNYRCNTGEDTVNLSTMSTSHDFPLCGPGVLGTMMYGGKNVISMTPSFDEINEYIKNEKVTITQVAPAIISMWIDCLEWEDDTDFSSMKYVEIGAAKLERELAQKIEDSFGVKIIQGYGLGEGITCFTNYYDDSEVAWESQGTPVSEYDEIKIVDENGNEVPDGEAGELIERGPYTFEGYYNAPERNKEAFTEDGFLKTGDKAVILPGGRIKILGRVREQINRAGENVIPSEIEEYLKRLPGVHNAAVFGLKDDDLGERICAVLVADEEKELKNICIELSGQGLAPYKLPDELHYVKDMPLINVGKIDKRALKEQIANEVA